MMELNCLKLIILDGHILLRLLLRLSIGGVACGSSKIEEDVMWSELNKMQYLR